MGGIIVALGQLAHLRTSIHLSSAVLTLVVCSLSTSALLGRGKSPQEQRADSAKTIVLTVISTPPDADVLIDGKMVGRTPLQLISIRPGLRELRIEKTGFCDFMDSLLITGVSLTRDVRLDSSCGVSITSVPDSAGVYLDNILVGRSPLKLTNLRPGWRSVKLVKPNWAIWENRIHLAPGNLVTVNAPMQSKFATLNVEVHTPGISLSIDGRRIGTGSLVDHMIPAGRHDIRASREEESDSVTETVYLQPGETAQWEARFDVPSRRAFWYSLAAPGLGQIVNGSSVEGLTIIGGFVASGVLAFVMDLKYASEVSKQNDLRAAYRSARTEEEAKSAGDAYMAHFSDMKTTRTIRNVGIVVAGVIYLYSLVDAFINHDSVNVISPLANQDDQSTGATAQLTSSGYRISFRIPI